MKKYTVLWLALMFCLPTVAFADVLYLKSGKKMEGKVIEQTETATKIVTAQGLKLVFYKDEIDRLERGSMANSADKKLEETTAVPVPAVTGQEDSQPVESSAETTTAPETTSPIAVPDQVDQAVTAPEEVNPESTGETKSSAVSLPDINAPEMVSPVTGILKGKTFVPDRVEIQDDIIAFKQGDDAALYVFLFLPKGESLENKKFSVIPETGIKSPHIHLKWKAENAGDNNTAALVSGYTMRLEFSGLNEEGRLSGTIFIQLPEQNQTKLEGTFEAQIL